MNINSPQQMNSGAMRSANETIPHLATDHASWAGKWLLAASGKILDWRSVLFMMAIFFAISLPIGATLNHYRGDERFYTDAAMRMLQTGDYVTPYYATGNIRFNKPILTYWVVCTNFLTFGINVLASRLGQILAGTLLLMATYLLTRALGFPRKAAVLAAAIIAANFEVINTSVHATTDIIQSCAITFGIFGVCRILFQGSRKWHDYAFFYFSLTLAVLTKGAMSLIFLVLLVAFVCWRRKQLNIRLRDLVHVPTLIPALIMVTFWFALALRQHGMTVFRLMFHDQVVERIDKPTNPLKNLGTYLGGTAAEFLPWTLLI